MEENIENSGLEAVSNLSARFFSAEDFDVDTVSPLVLAYIGDAVYELIVRSFVLSKGNRPVNKLHKKSADLVKAHSQAELGKFLKDGFNSKELSVYKRGRNAKSHTVAKNATVSDYRYATAFEALIGYLYLSGQNERIFELINKAKDFFEM